MKDEKQLYVQGCELCNWQNPSAVIFLLVYSIQQKRLLPKQFKIGKQNPHSNSLLIDKLEKRPQESNIWFVMLLFQQRNGLFFFLLIIQYRYSQNHRRFIQPAIFKQTEVSKKHQCPWEKCHTANMFSFQAFLTTRTNRQLPIDKPLGHTCITTWWK